MKFLLKFQKVLYLNYYKMSEENIRDMIFSFFNMILMEYDYSLENEYLTPFHLISLFDPKAEWIKPWINNKSFITYIINYFKEKDKINNIISNVCYFYDKFYGNGSLAIKKDEILLISVIDKGLLYQNYMSFIFFIQNFFILMKISSTPQGLKLFPINCDNIINKNNFVKKYCIVENGIYIYIFYEYI